MSVFKRSINVARNVRKLFEGMNAAKPKSMAQMMARTVGIYGEVGWWRAGAGVDAGVVGACHFEPGR